MKLPALRPFSTWLALALFSALIVVPILPGNREKNWAFQLVYEVQADTGGMAQLYWDGGKGFAEQNSSTCGFAAGKSTVRLPLPPGTHGLLRLDPLARAGRVSIHDIRIEGPLGRSSIRLAPTDFAASNEIASLTAEGGGLKIATTPESADAQLLWRPRTPLELKLSPLDWPIHAGIAFAILALGVLALRVFRPDWRSDAKRFFVYAAKKPGRAIAWVALVSTAGATYPVLFLGESFVSPNNEGAPLLYETWPTVAGYRESRIFAQRGTDVGAILWQHIPYSVLQGDAFAEGTLPLWNRYNSCGNTMIGQGQSMFGDPFLLPVIAARGASWAWDLRFVFARWLFCVGIGGCAWLLTRRIGPVLLVTAAAAWIGFFNYRLNHPAIFSLSVAPGVLFAWMWIAQAATARARFRAAGLIVFSSVALLCSGTVKEAYMLLFSMHAAGLLFCLSSGASFRDRAGRVLTALAAGGVFILLTSPVWLVFYFQLRSAYTSYNLAQVYQVQPAMLLGFFDELFYRPLNRYLWVFNPSLNWLFLIGAAAVATSLGAALASKPVRALLIASLGAGCLAFGVIPPEWIAKVPFVANVAHIDNTFSCSLIVFGAVLSAWGFAQAADGLAQPGRKDLLLLGLAVLVPVALWLGFCHSIHRSVYGAGITFSPLPDAPSPLHFTPFIWISLAAMLAATAVGGLVLRQVLLSRRASSAQLVLLAACAATFLWRNGVHPSPTGFAVFTNVLGPRVDFHAPSRALETVRATQAETPSRAIGLKGNLFPGWTSFVRVEGIAGPDALVNPYYRELCTASPVRREWDWRLDVRPDEVSKVRNFLDFLNVRYYLDYRSDQALLGSQLKPVRMGDLDVYESPKVWPRAFFTNRVAQYGDAAALASLVNAGDGRPFAAIQTTDLGAPDYRDALRLMRADAAERRVEPAMEYRLGANSTEFTIDAPTRGIAVLCEVWQRRDFRATVNGREVPVLRVNHAFKGVAIDGPGLQRVRIWYSPRGYTESLWLACGGILILAIAALRYRRLPHSPV